MPKEESDSWNVDALIEEPHRKGMPEAMEGDMLVDAGRLNQLRDLVVQDWRGQGREDGSSFLDSPQGCDGLLGKRKANFIPRLLDGETQVVPAFRFLDVLPF